jgi:hypothetical protein
MVKVAGNAYRVSQQSLLQDIRPLLHQGDKLCLQMDVQTKCVVRDYYTVLGTSKTTGNFRKCQTYLSKEMTPTHGNVTAHTVIKGENIIPYGISTKNAGHCETSAPEFPGGIIFPRYRYRQLHAALLLPGTRCWLDSGTVTVILPRPNMATHGNARHYLLLLCLNSTLLGMYLRRRCLATPATFSSSTIGIFPLPSSFKQDSEMLLAENALSFDYDENSSPTVRAVWLAYWMVHRHNANFQQTEETVKRTIDALVWQLYNIEESTIKKREMNTPGDVEVDVDIFVDVDRDDPAPTIKRPKLS